MEGKTLGEGGGYSVERSVSFRKREIFFWLEGQRQKGGGEVFLERKFYMERSFLGEHGCLRVADS